jgi:6-phosphogluconolactonase
MKVEIHPTAAGVATRAAQWIAASARAAIAERGLFSIALSGGRTPWQMLGVLTSEPLPWPACHVFQTDERVAPEGHPDRNVGHIRACLGVSAFPAANLHAMPVNDPDLNRAADRYAHEIETVAGSPAVFDAIHLGLGADGHTASLVPGDGALDVREADVTLTGVYAGWARMTLTYPLIDRARAILWVVTGPDKAPALRRLVAGDRSIPAGQVRSDRAIVLADRAAAAGA